MPPNTTAGLVTISRAELALRDASYAKLHPATHAFTVPSFKDGVRDGLEMIHKLDRKGGSVVNVLRGIARKGYPLGDHQVHILPVDRNSVKHGWVVDQVARQGGFDALAIPSGKGELHEAILGSRVMFAHCTRRFQSLRDFIASEKAVVEECVQFRHLIEVLDRKILLRVREHNKMWGMGLRSRVKWDFMEEKILHYPFFRAAWVVGMKEVVWCGISPQLFEERARGKTLAAEWERAIALEAELSKREKNVSDWFFEVTKSRESVLTPQELVSDLNMRHAVGRIRGLPKRKKILLVVPAVEYHLALGWISASDLLSLTSLTEACDPRLDLVPTFTKARKTPEFHAVERAIHVDTPESSLNSDEKALSQDRRLAVAFGGHNPHMQKSLRPSPAIKVIDVGRGREKGGEVLRESEITAEARKGYFQTLDGVV